MTSDYVVPMKTGYRGKTLNVPQLQFSQDFAHSKLTVPNRRVCIGGRGREWCPMAYNVLKEMSKNDEISVLMQPVDAIKHPEYYTMVADPVDLSKIQLKFHNGCYSSINTFIEDVNLMFDNYFLIFEDKSPMHSNLQKAKLKFEEEMGKIKQLYGMNKTFNRFTFPKTISERIDAIEAENRSVLGVPFIIPSPSSTSLLTSSSSSSSLPNSPSSLLVKYPANNAIPNKLTSCKAQQIVLKKVISSNSSTTFSTNSLAVTKPIYTVRLPSRSSKVGPAVVTASSTVSTSTGSILQRKQVVLVPKGLKTNNSEPFIILQPNGNNNVTVNPSNHFSSIINKNINNKSNEKVTEATSSSSTSEELSLIIDATNVWFGSARTTPVRPIAVNDRGLLITCQNNFLKKGSGGKTTRIYSVKDLIQFQIKPEDIIKCCAYLGSQRKHTIFLFLLPNCIRSFKQMISAIDTSPDAAEGFCDSCLIAIFTPALSRHDISQLVYFMWHFGQSSLFGPTIYSEICQKSALSLLSNIKPALLASKCFVESSESFSSFSSPSKPQPPAKPSQTATQNSRCVSNKSSANVRSLLVNNNKILNRNCNGSAGEDSGDNGVKFEPIITNPLSSPQDESDEGNAMDDDDKIYDSNDGGGTMQIEEITLNEVQLKQEPNDGFNDDELIEIHSCNFNTADEISNVDNMPARSSVVRTGDEEDEENEEDEDSGVRSKVRRRPGILSRRGRKRKTADNNKMVGTSKNSASYEDGDCLQIHTSRSKKSKNDSSRAFNGNLDDVDSSSVHGVTRNDESVVDGDDNSEPNYSIVTSPSNCGNNNYSRADEERRSGNTNVAEEEEEEEDDAETNDVSTNGGEETEDAFSNESDACDLEIVMPVESDSEVDYVKAAADQLLSLSEEARADVMVMGGRPQTKCPITQSTMIEPVRNKLCGHSYDRKGALQLINMRANKARCPVPGCANVEPLNEDQLEEDAQIKMLLNLS